MKKILSNIEFHDGGQLVNYILVTLGKKTKLQFAQALLEEFNKIKSMTHQYMLSADVIRVANAMGIDVKQS